MSKETVEALAAPPAPPTHGTRDIVMQADMAWSLGFMRPSAARWACLVWEEVVLQQ